MTKELKLTALLFFAITASFGQQIKMKPLLSPGDLKNMASIKPHHGPVRWWHHTNENNSCVGSGVYCFSRRLFTEQELANIKPGADETINEISIQRSNNFITIKSVGIAGQLNPKTIEAFRNKKVDIPGGKLSREVVNSLFKDIGVEAPMDGLQFKPEEQTYSLNQTTYNGRVADIIEVVEKTTIALAGKSYHITVITTSGKGAGSPKNQGF